MNIDNKNIYNAIEELNKNIDEILKITEKVVNKYILNLIQKKFGKNIYWYKRRWLKLYFIKYDWWIKMIIYKRS